MSVSSHQRRSVFRVSLGAPFIEKLADKIAFFAPAGPNDHPVDDVVLGEPRRDRLARGAPHARAWPTADLATFRRGDRRHLAVGHGAER